ncbi:MAG: 1-acyl-sn-glycerol-3-phosphate acyltransferase [Myxococcota bacterium]
MRRPLANTELSGPASNEPAERATGLFHPRPRSQVLQDLTNRSRRRLETLDHKTLETYLEDALYAERKRLRKAKDAPERHHLDALAKALVHNDRDRQIEAGLGLVSTWADEIHGRFSPGVYRLATRAMPRMLSMLLSSRPDRLRNWDLSPHARLAVRGDVDLLRTLSREATLVLCPTHVSNLDSPLIGLALYLAGLPPFVYGAGLNLFDNAMVGWWMHRLGAYTVDRTKKALLYKDVLKDYSIRAITTRHHSLFFPGGTRCRSGEIEAKLKKGLLGTAIVGWQEMLQTGRADGDVYVVPLTLSYTLVLEAATLIEDHLADAGKQRYIITDDEFAKPSRLAAFFGRVLDLDSAIVAHFGQPMDVLGNPVSSDPNERREQAKERARYVCDAQGNVEWDPQRDRIYTDRLAGKLVESFVENADVLATHAAAYAAWTCLEEEVGTRDPFRLVRVPLGRRRFPRGRVMQALETTLSRVHDGVREGRWGQALPATAEGLLEVALDRFGRYHRSRALKIEGSDVVIQDPKLCLYYRNRLEFIDRPHGSPLAMLQDGSSGGAK